MSKEEINKKEMERKLRMHLYYFAELGLILQHYDRLYELGLEEACKKFIEARMEDKS